MPAPPPTPSQLLQHGPPVPLTHAQIKRLIIDYLVSSSYINTALAFAGEIQPSDADEPSGDHEEFIPPNGTTSSMEVDFAVDSGSAVSGGATATTRPQQPKEGWPELPLSSLEETRQRRDIVESLRAGQITRALALLTAHFPSVIDPTVAPPVQVDTNAFFLPPPSSLASSLPPSSKLIAPPTLTPAEQAAAYSIVRPDILHFKLRLQAFIELFKPSSSHGVTDMDSSTLTLAAAAADSPLGGGLDSMSASFSSTTSESTAFLLATSKEIYTEAHRFSDPTEKGIFLKEAVDVAALMAYNNPENSSVKGYLDQNRREALAELCNASILAHTGHAPTPVLAMLVRHTTATWGVLHEQRASYATSTKAFSSNGGSSSSGALSSGEKDKERSALPRDEKGKVLRAPPFDFRAFLNEREDGSSSFPPRANGASSKPASTSKSSAASLAVPVPPRGASPASLSPGNRSDGDGGR